MTPTSVEAVGSGLCQEGLSLTSAGSCHTSLLIQSLFCGRLPSLAERGGPGWGWGGLAGLGASARSTSSTKGPGAGALPSGEEAMHWLSLVSRAPWGLGWLCIFSCSAESYRLLAEASSTETLPSPSHWRSRPGTLPLSPLGVCASPARGK